MNELLPLPGRCESCGVRVYLIGSRWHDVDGGEFVEHECVPS